jgi:flavin reductase (DIM6/NTAB) family NADH-FMN oxidoreductase RutF
MQRELLDQQQWQTIEEVGGAIFEWIGAWYNPGRRQTSLGMLSRLLVVVPCGAPWWLRVEVRGVHGCDRCGVDHRLLAFRHTGRLKVSTSRDVAIAPRAIVDLAVSERPSVASLKRTFSCFPSGVAAICGTVDGESVGMVASTFTSVSLDPPLVSVCMDRKSSTWPRLRTALTIGISILNQDQGAICRQLSSKSLDRFARVPLSTGAGGALFIDGASAWFECSIESEIPAGDHFIVLLRIEALDGSTDQGPLIFHGSSFKQLNIPDAG